MPACCKHTSTRVTTSRLWRHLPLQQRASHKTCVLPPPWGFLTMAEAPEASIDTSLSPLSPASSPPPSTPPDLIDEATPPPLKSPWSQIVRGSPNPPRSEAVPPSCNVQLDEQNERLHHLHLSPELRVTDTAAADVDTSPISSLSDRRQGVHDMLTQMTTTSPDRSINESVLVDSKLTQQSPAKSSKQAWGKLIPNPALNLEPEPVMGAVTWPPLSEARSAKAPESFKAGATPKAGPKSPSSSSSSSNERHHLQRETDRNTVKQKMIDQAIVNGNNPQNVAIIDTASPGKILHPADAEQPKWSGGRDSRVASASEAPSMHVKGNVVASHMANKESSRNFAWDQGRGNHSFPAYGRGHANVREHTLPGHQQRGGQRNLPQPFVPFINPNPGFVHPAGYQNVPSSMYYMPAPTSEPVLGATYFVPSAVQGMFVPGPDLLTLQGMVVKQIDYYFSVENLCRDIFLRSKMDEWGFVPVSVIANFNRVRMITQNPYFIIEALRLSNVVEVQGDKVRKKGDWANWLLPSSQPSTPSSGNRDQAVRFSSSSRKAEVDRLKSVNSKPVGADNQSNGHSHLASQIRERVEAHSVSAVNAQDGIQDSFSREGTGGFSNDGRLQDLQVDNIDREHSTQSCGVESGHTIE